MPYKNEDIRKEKAAERWGVWAKRNPERVNQRTREWRARNPKYMLRKSAERRAKLSGVVFNLSLDDIPDIPEVCPIALIPLHHRNDGKQGPCDNSPSLDRVDPSQGYIKDNIRVISHKGNRWKSDMTLEDLERLVLYMKSQTE